MPIAIAVIEAAEKDMIKYLLFQRVRLHDLGVTYAVQASKCQNNNSNQKNIDR
jgi:hypothetical protein